MIAHGIADGVMFAEVQQPPSVVSRLGHPATMASTELYTIDPLTDSRWAKFVAEHPKASIFHQSGWLRALAVTYGYKPLVVTDATPPQPIREAIAFCKVESWITGRRLVSLPFADHCEPLLEGNQRISEFSEWLSADCDRQNWKYIELRPLTSTAVGKSSFGQGSSYWLHTLDLTSSIEDIFRRFDKDSVQRRISRAEREDLSYERGYSERLLEDFYHLLLLTRRRHRWLPQPRAWFRNLAENLGDALQIRVVRDGNTPIATLLSLRFRNTVVYKYGCSDQRYHNLGGIPLLFWKLIEESKAEGAELLDFGRTDLEHDRLVRFKDQFGTTRRQITYCRYPTQTAQQADVDSWSSLRRVCSLMPDPVLSLAGRLAYRHIG